MVAVEQPSREVTMSETFLEGFTRKEIRRIEKSGHEITVPAGWSPMWEGTGPDKAYIIRSGEVSIRHGREKIATVSEGDIVGEAGIVNNRLRNATVVALTPLTVLRLSSTVMRELAADIPHFRDQLQSAMERHGVPGGTSETAADADPA